ASVTDTLWHTPTPCGYRSNNNFAVRPAHGGAPFAAPQELSLPFRPPQTPHDYVVPYNSPSDPPLHDPVSGQNEPSPPFYEDSKNPLYLLGTPSASKDSRFHNDDSDRPAESG